MLIPISGARLHHQRSEVRWRMIKLQRVLIIEDEPDMVLGLRDNFEYEGYDVLVARDGREGLIAPCRQPRSHHSRHDAAER